jgi:hypothetical protein
VSDQPGTLTLFHAPDTDYNRGVTTTVSSRGFIPEGTVPALPWASILLPDEKRRLRLIKIDVEGGEGPIVQNLLETIHDYSESMASETIANALDINALVKRFSAAGFRAYAIFQCLRDVVVSVTRSRLSTFWKLETGCKISCFHDSFQSSNINRR